ncbi:MAG TPA: HD domain-containing protein [Candidatus Glassbacteria bacterium]|nr:HD domain-containing protein [Candidatus Glassbacteria bacterium]
MQVHVDDLIPGMELASAVQLKAGSYLITPKEAPDGLDSRFIDSIQRFSSQIAPLPKFVDIKDTQIALEQIRSVLCDDLRKSLKQVRAGGEVPNFFESAELLDKVERVVDKIFSNPEMAVAVYGFKNMLRENAGPLAQILDHSFRTTLLAVALGVRLKLSLIALINLGIAALLHDVGMLSCEEYPRLEVLDEMGEGELEQFVERHVKLSLAAFNRQKMTLLPQTREDIRRIIASHHRLDLAEEKPRSPAMLLHLACLIDEMIGPLPYRARFSFAPRQLRVLGPKFSLRTGIVRVILGLVKLHRKNPAVWPVLLEVAELFQMRELTVENYEEKLRDMLEFCPFGKKKAYPGLGGNAMPRTVYCNNGDPEFTCEHMSQAQIAVQNPAGKIQYFFKCGTLTNRLTELNGESKKEQVTARAS